MALTGSGLRNPKDRFYSDQRLQDYDSRYTFKSLGYNLRMPDITAAIGLVQLAKLDDLHAQRRQIVSRLKEITGASSYLEVPTVREGGLSAYYRFSLIVSADAPFSRKEWVLHLERHGIETRAMMGRCLPGQPGFVGQNHRVQEDLPNSRTLRDRALFVGCHPGIKDEGLAHMERSAYDRSSDQRAHRTGGCSLITDVDRLVRAYRLRRAECQVITSLSAE